MHVLFVVPPLSFYYYQELFSTIHCLQIVIFVKVVCCPWRFIKAWY